VVPVLRDKVTTAATTPALLGMQAHFRVAAVAAVQAGLVATGTAAVLEATVAQARSAFSATQH
jgi:hypothetical protein